MAGNVILAITVMYQRDRTGKERLHGLLTRSRARKRSSDAVVIDWHGAAELDSRAIG